MKATICKVGKESLRIKLIQAYLNACRTIKLKGFFKIKENTLTFLLFVSVETKMIYKTNGDKIYSR